MHPLSIINVVIFGFESSTELKIYYFVTVVLLLYFVSYSIWQSTLKARMLYVKYKIYLVTTEKLPTGYQCLCACTGRTHS